MVSSGDVQTRFERMTAIGDLLLDSLRLEEALGKTCEKKQTAKTIEEWKLARHSVDALAVDYETAVREWCELVDSQISTKIACSNLRLPIPAKDPRAPARAS